MYCVSYNRSTIHKNMKMFRIIFVNLRKPVVPNVEQVIQGFRILSSVCIVACQKVGVLIFTLIFMHMLFAMHKGYGLPVS